MLRIPTILLALALVPVLVNTQTQAPSLEGTWRGTLDTGAGQLRLALRVSKAADGLLIGILDSLDQATSIPVDRIIVTGATVRLELKSVGGTFEGAMNAAGTELKGTWTQSAPLPLTLTRDTSAAAAATPVSPPPGPASFPFGLPIQLSVPITPTPFLGDDGQRYLVYEVHATNFGARDLLLGKLDVLQGATTLASYEGTELSSSILQPGTATGPDRRTLAAGKTSVVFLWIPVTTVPASLRHRITVGEVSIEGAPIAPSSTAPIAIGPPLDGADWLAANGPGKASPHRRAFIPIEGRGRIAQRFAIDWVRLNPNGQTFSGDARENKSYRAYGAEALAVADAVVAATKDGIPENIPGPTSRAVPITLETVGGNHVVLDLGGGRFAFYAHLQPGSLRVKTGDRVTRGQVIGLVGNSGNSTEPHLHFHVSDGVSPLGSEGLPYALAGMPGMPLQNERVTFKR
jgi:murein DD-endopeptidase MepM/ murein hydrolase activator NlpD